jgi:alkylation response protein AidB-like acyl-CoA dehydrogenase
MTDSPRWLDAARLADLADLAHRADADAAWPADSLRLAAELGATAWGVPAEYGGRGLDRAAQLEGSEQLAAACLTTAFILSQREAALRWLVQAPEPIRRRFLPAAARGELFFTVGLSQLTTSGQHRPPSLRATAGPAGYRLDGDIPWVTGADAAAGVVTGGVLEDGRQVLLLLPPGLPGAVVDAPLPLAALAGSRTTRVHCDGVDVPAEWVLAGPGEQLVRSGGGLETSCLALGLTRAAVDFLLAEAEARAYVRPAAARLGEVLGQCRGRLHVLARSGAAGEEALALRVEVTRLVLRATQAALAVAKGAGFLVGHPAQRWARQAQFFLVWSCPQPVAAALLAELSTADSVGW